MLEYHHLDGTLYPVNGTQQLLWSNLGMLLAEHNMSVLARLSLLELFRARQGS